MLGSLQFLVLTLAVCKLGPLTAASGKAAATGVTLQLKLIQKSLIIAKIKIFHCRAASTVRRLTTLKKIIIGENNNSV